MACQAAHEGGFASLVRKALEAMIRSVVLSTSPQEVPDLDVDKVLCGGGESLPRPSFSARTFSWCGCVVH